MSEGRWETGWEKLWMRLLEAMDSVASEVKFKEAQVIRAECHAY